METKRLHITKAGALETEFVAGEALERYDRLALEALDECRKSLMMALRFLNAALWHLPFDRAPLIRTIATNGRVLRYDPERVIDRYRDDANELVRDCLHAVLHCTFHHPFDVRHAEHDAWSLACDIAVELCAMELAGERFASKLDMKRVEAAEKLAPLTRNMTAPALYQVLRAGNAGEALYLSNGLTGADLACFSNLFRRDAHDLWASHPHPNDSRDEARDGRPEAVPDLQGAGGASAPVSAGGGFTEPGSAESKADAGEAGGGDMGESRQWQSGKPGDDASAPRNGADASSSDSTDDDMAEQSDTAADQPLSPEMQEALGEWERISKRVDAEMRAQHSLSGEGAMLRNLTVANHKPADHDEFLRRFATIAEDMRINDEEFDYIFYTYGLNRYGNIPLVEPLEYRESKRVREFVIALDTSGSCSGELVKTFVERTYDVLRQQTSFGDEINVHLVQCDNRIRTATKITSLRQLESYGDSFWVSGGGGTDFRPVFEYVDALVEDGEFDDLRGLIYFTDGYGTFPTRAPSYDAAFVFVDSEETDVKVPAWAMKVLMTQEEVMAAVSR